MRLQFSPRTSFSLLVVLQEKFFCSVQLPMYDYVLESSWVAKKNSTNARVLY